MSNREGGVASVWYGAAPSALKSAGSGYYLRCVYTPFLKYGGSVLDKSFFASFSKNGLMPPLQTRARAEAVFRVAPRAVVVGAEVEELDHAQQFIQAELPVLGGVIAVVERALRARFRLPREGGDSESTKRIPASTQDFRLCWNDAAWAARDDMGVGRLGRRLKNSPIFEAEEAAKLPRHVRYAVQLCNEREIKRAMGGIRAPGLPHVV